jgi:hypothetical protein
MSELNGARLLRRRTSMLSRLVSAGKETWMWLQLLQPPVKLALGLILLVLVTLLSGCATQSPPSVPPTIPQPPQISEPTPSESFSLRVEKLLEKWSSAVIGL